MKESATVRPSKTSGNKKHEFISRKRTSHNTVGAGAGALTAHEVTLAFQRLHRNEDLGKLLQAPYSWLTSESASQGGHGTDLGISAKAHNAHSEQPKYVSPFAAVNSSKGAWAPKTYDTTTMTIPSAVPALERITLCLGVLDWAILAAPKANPPAAFTIYARNVIACNAWYEQARLCIRDGIHVPLHTLLYSWEALATMSAELRRDAGGGGQGRRFAVAVAVGAGQGQGQSVPVVDTDSIVDSQQQHQQQQQSLHLTSQAAYKGLTSVLESLVDKSANAVRVQDKCTYTTANASASAELEGGEGDGSGELAMAAKPVNKVILFQTLYSLVKSSLATSPHQLSEGRSGDFSTADLTILESLMQSMITSGIKSTELIKTVGDLCERNEFFSWYGNKALPLFDQLVSLEENTLALRVLEQYHRQSSEGRGLDILGTSYFDAGLSGPALNLLWKELHRKLTSPSTWFTAGDMVLALSIFSRVDQIPASGGATGPAAASRGGGRVTSSITGKESKYTKMLASVEVGVVQQLTEQLKNGSQSQSQASADTLWTPKDCSQVLSCYGKVGRLHPVMVDLLNRLLGNFFQEGNSNLLPMEFSSIVHANARLNNRPSFLKAMGRAIIEPYKLRADMIRTDSKRSKNTWTHLNFGRENSIKSFISVLWSLSVLECLDEKTYDSIQPLLEIVHEHAGGMHLEGFIRTAFDQISLDQQFVRGTFQKSGMRNDIDGHFYSNKSVEVISSRLHQDVSTTLQGMGVSHVNEAVLNNGYTADIFIPPKSDFSNFVYLQNSLSADYDRHSKSVGTVIEIDGPGHFETYMMRPLGKTAMKQRHIRQAGYNLISLPYWQWPFHDGHDGKKEALVALLKNSCMESSAGSK